MSSTILSREAIGHDGVAPLEVAPNVARLKVGIVNVYFIGEPGKPNDWVLIDAGVPMSGRRIIRAAESRFGKGARPKLIVLTHGHFDHVGALHSLLQHWGGVAVYAHRLEQPFLTGRSAYPPGDWTISGMMARSSPLFPDGPFDFRPFIHELPVDGSVPGLSAWQWLHTPGHSPGHVSLFRSSDGVMIAGDAVVTTRQERLYDVMTQRAVLSGPPAYYTPDWVSAGASVKVIASLAPSVLACGHGVPMSGAGLDEALTYLATSFRRAAVPRKGRYVKHPATFDENGVASLPPVHVPTGLYVALGLAVVLGAGLYWLLSGRPRVEDDERPC